MKQLQKIDKSIFINILISLSLLSIPFLTSPDLTNIGLFQVPPFQRTLLSYCLLLCFFYANYYVFVPKLYTTKKWISLFITLVIFYFIILKLPTILFGKPKHFIPLNAPPLPVQHKLNKSVLHSVFLRDNYFFQFIVVFLLSLFLRIEEYVKKIKNEKLITEISYLRAQVNPHFLFNTLNSLYSLTLIKSDKAPDAVLKLSNLMRYTVTDSNQEKIALQKEINYINNYIELQKLRLTDTTKIITTYKGIFMGYTIAPMLLINFIENAFKYGTNAEDDANIWVQISVDEYHKLELNVKNTIVDVSKKKIEISKKGIENTKKRLSLLYPDAFELRTEEINNFYIVSLIIQLDD